VLKVLLTPVFMLLWRVKVEGREHIPRRGPAILAANHQSFCDSFFLPFVLRRRLTYVAKAEYFDNWRTSWFFRAAGQIPMRREGGDASQRALDTARDVLQGGRLLGIYPEGTRAPDERLHRGHTGAARLALRCHVPLIPVGIAGTREVQPPGSRLMRPFRTVTVRFGPPVTYESHGTLVTTGECSDSGGPGGCATESSPPPPPPPPPPPSSSSSSVSSSVEDEDPALLRCLTDALMASIAQLSDQKYVDHYARRGA
jgi:1-acyl-sn-glycerol-3-phosphate acyltransferase